MPADGAGGNSPARAEPADVIGRCQVHKLRNVRDHLPEGDTRAGDQADPRPTTPAPPSKRRHQHFSVLAGNP